MARRPPYTAVEKHGQLRADHVQGMGDVTFRHFQCVNYECQEFLTVRDSDVKGSFSFACPKCGYVMEDGGTSKFYDFDLVLKDPKTKKTIKKLEEGVFEVAHDLYVRQAPLYKFCIICNTLKPLESFDIHRSRQSGRQGECRLCKTIYNAIKNRTRIPDQHREAAQRRRIYVAVSGTSDKIDSKAVFAKFDSKCFRCGRILVDKNGTPIPGEFHLDHTLPAYYLWPLTTDSATLLCRTHNAEKSGKWPSSYYSTAERKRLAALTGLSFELLSGTPQINPEAVDYLKAKKNVVDLVEKFAAYIDEVHDLRNRVKSYSGIDIYEVAKGSIAGKHAADADALLKSGKKKN